MPRIGITEEIRIKAIEILDGKPDGLRYPDLVKQLAAAFPAANLNTIRTVVGGTLERERPRDVYKPARGLYRLTKYREQSQVVEAPSTPTITTPTTAPPVGLETVEEEDFYDPFAKYLEGDLDECTRAIPLGGNMLRWKWGTPDVIGVYESRRTHIIKSDTVLVSAEVKLETNTNSLITAFGQACSYRLFSHKVYLVIPEDTDDETEARLEALCQIFGIGLILFNRSDAENPEFRIRMRAVRGEPDIFYVNEHVLPLADRLFP
ncbi:MAG TPA: hypothetical protein VF944_09300 [Candidatus Bathyarchaeia archaeon]